MVPSHAPAARPPPRGSALDFLDDAAADHDGVCVSRDRERALRSRMPNPTPTGICTCLRISASFRARRQCRDATHPSALERHVIHVAAREAGDFRDTRLGVVGARRKIGAMPCVAITFANSLPPPADSPRRARVQAGVLRTPGERGQAHRFDRVRIAMSTTGVCRSLRRNCATTSSTSRGTRAGPGRARTLAGSRARPPSDRRTVRRVRSVGACRDEGLHDRHRFRE